MLTKTKIKFLAPFLLLLFVTGCGSNISNEEISTTLDKINGEFQQRENVKFLLKTIIHRDNEMATVNLKGVEFIQTGQAYYLGYAGEHRLELYKDKDNNYIKDGASSWVSVEAGGASELKTFINLPSRLLEYTQYGEFEILEDSINRRKHSVISGVLSDEGVNKYISAFAPELLHIIDDVFVELSLYIDSSKGTLNKMDIFINELNGNFSLVSEITIVEYDIETEIIAPK